MFAVLALALAAPLPTINPPLPEDALALIKQLDDPESEVRLEAIRKLRLLARRVDRVGGQREQRGEEFEPKVKGLVPHLIRAAKDEDETNRWSTLYALADTLDPAAIAIIRDSLKDKSERVRFTAACLLTEFKDASGLDELKKALARFGGKPRNGVFDTERLLASLERITGKSFGPIPADPFLLSDLKLQAASEKRYVELLDIWTVWWDWKP
jgi:hypothetical protein